MAIDVTSAGTPREKLLWAFRFPSFIEYISYDITFVICLDSGFNYFLLVFFGQLNSTNISVVARNHLILCSKVITCLPLIECMTWMEMV